jgi:hypothetical protein
MHMGIYLSIYLSVYEHMYMHGCVDGPFPCSSTKRAPREQRYIYALRTALLLPRVEKSCIDAFLISNLACIAAASLKFDKCTMQVTYTMRSFFVLKHGPVSTNLICVMNHTVFTGCTLGL